nr:hypothetical protein A5482_12375 [Cyanobacterium sp. IPPAS B-1200]
MIWLFNSISYKLRLHLSKYFHSFTSYQLLKRNIFKYKHNTFFIFVLLTLQFILGCENNPLIRLEGLADVPSLDNEEIIRSLGEKDDLGVCNSENHLISDENTNIYELNTTEYLVEIFCFVGAYQGSYQYLFYDANQAEHLISTLSFTVFEERGGSLQIGETSLLTGALEFDPETEQLMVDRKARGLGDCGSYATYQWQDDNFTLVEYRYKGQCDGVYIPVEEYPLIYP